MRTRIARTVPAEDRRSKLGGLQAGEAAVHRFGVPVDGVTQQGRH